MYVCKWEVPPRVLWLSNTIHSHAENLHSNPSCKKKIFKKMSGSLILIEPKHALLNGFIITNIINYHNTFLQTKMDLSP